MDDDGMAAPPPLASPGGGVEVGMGGHGTHMTFFWGIDAEILFSGFPGERGLPVYLLALASVFVAALLIESLSCFSRRLFSTTRRAALHLRLFMTFLHSARIGLAYLAMLATMSFNGGVLLAVVAGHALGFFLFSTSASRWGHRPVATADGADKPSPSP